jgi:hypothetical protein
MINLRNAYEFMNLMLCLVEVKRKRMKNGERKRERAKCFSFIWLECKSREKKMRVGEALHLSPPFFSSNLGRKRLRK